MSFPGEQHALLWKNGEFVRANYMGPGTHVVERIRRGDQPVTASDRVAQAHDIRYTLRVGQRAADEHMIRKLRELRAAGEDSTVNTLEGEIPITAKLALNNLGIFKETWYGTQAQADRLTPDDKMMLRRKLWQLEQQGYGMAGGHWCAGCNECPICSRGYAPRT